MSLVGPRPPIPYEVEHYPPHWFDRFAVKPGMTGLWQVSGRSELGLEEMIALDVEYARTPLAVAQREDPGAHRAGRLRRPWGRLMRAGRVLIISENAPVPADRRVWNISRTLAAAGWQVVIACAQGADRDDAPYEVLEGIEIHRYPLRPAGSTLGYAREYGQALWRLRKLVRRLSRERRFDVVHACNPPDLLLLAARSLRRQGTRFIFDHHDLVPELYRSRFGRGEDLGYRATLRAERVAYRMADVSLATNGSYARVAVERGGMDPEDVFVVRNGPDLDALPPGRARPGVAPRARPPDLLPRDHGPAGRRRPRAARPRRAAGAARRLARGLHRRRRRAARHARAGRRAGASATTSSSPAGAATTTSA